ncbi:DNA-invertase hin [Phycisphaerae bacterium RAS1]|nr:DNA-invertase hin [Phycisphaerae bacterium RAS1]
MSRHQTSAKKPAIAPATRCAIYTRKSSDEGLQQDFNSLDAQREAAEAYIASQKNEGWRCVPDRYDDGGFTGGNTDRPALQRLLADIEAGKVDTVVVYKIDRFSRSLADFMRMMTVFEQHGVTFVSVTQAFDTSSSMGRLTLNILLSFAQFEREIIGERIRDKIAASRQRGKWTGGTPVLGYDVDRANGGPKLVINPTEAARIRQIFEMYLELRALLPVVAELERRDWRNKAWTTRDGRQRGGLSFDKCRLHDVLTNVVYIGKVRHKDQIYAGEHEPIVPDDVFARVQRQLQQNGRRGNPELRNKHGSLLRGLLFCKACQRAMTHTFTSGENRRYRYYGCTNACKRGRDACPGRSLPAAEIERAVVDQIRGIAHDRTVLRDTLAETRAQADAALGRLADEKRTLRRGLDRLRADLLRAVTAEPRASGGADRIAELNDRVSTAERRLVEIEATVAELNAELVDEADVAAAFADFDGLWATLSPREQARVVYLLVRRVEFDAADGAIEVSFHAAGIKALASGNAGSAEEAA